MELKEGFYEHKSIGLCYVYENGSVTIPPGNDIYYLRGIPLSLCLGPNISRIDAADLIPIDPRKFIESKQKEIKGLEDFIEKIKSKTSQRKQ